MILGISDSHLATACLLREGEVIGCVSEERFTRRKNQGAYPAQAVDFLLAQAGVGPEALSAVALSGHEAMNPAWFESMAQDEKYIDEYLGIKKKSALGRKVRRVGKKLHLSSEAARKSLMPNEKRFQQIVDHLGVPKSRIHIVEHHTSHAAAAYYGSPFAGERRRRAAVLTNDAAGDGVCATWNAAGPGGIERLSASPSAAGSLGSFYSLITLYLGMRQLEHEYKVMGLAPYAPEWGRKRSYDVLRKMIVFETSKGPRFRWKVRKDRFRYLMENLARHRFDWVAAASQELLEEQLLAWVKAGVEAVGEGRVAVSGGVFMNVKANQKVAFLEEVKELFVLPSCGDESNAIGAAYWLHAEGTKERKPGRCTPLSELYLGRNVGGAEAEEAVAAMGLEKRHRVRRCDDIESEVARLLAKGEVVARVKGREEFGARALGNRSILANPSDYRVVALINKMIKSRDFWMPFAPTLLAERAGEYIENPRGMKSPYMMLTFDSTPKGREELAAACHPYDGTMRPQILEKAHNPDYHRLIEQFERLTGIGGVLNTSYNLHGEPIVSLPEDAVHTFESSGLSHLALDSFLISKKTAARF
ncbi:MAG: carbamoyltransferase C-terminal domain-containing protein [bacterium]